MTNKQTVWVIVYYGLESKLTWVSTPPLTPGGLPGRVQKRFRDTNNPFYYQGFYKQDGIDWKPAFAQNLTESQLYITQGAAGFVAANMVGDFQVMEIEVYIDK